MANFWGMKRIRHQVLAFLLLTLLSSGPAFSQTLLNTLNRYNEEYPHEKLHVQFDKPVYSAGETVWFKAYLFSKNMPSPVSTNFYTELLDGTGKLIEKKVYPVYESGAAGSFDLPRDIKGEGVLFRAFTTWMLNFDTAFLYTKYLRISKPEGNAAPTVSAPTTLRFLPEGGDWVATLPSVVAFKATGAGEQPRKASGVVKDDKGQVITTFRTVHDGMGKLKMTPEADATYTAEWTDESGRTGVTPLPPVQKEGSTLQIKPAGNKLIFIINRTANAAPRLNRVHLVANMHQFTVYRASANLAKSTTTSGTIPLDSLVSGILQVTLFDEEWKPVAERVVFVDRDDYHFSSSVHWITKNLGKRGKNVVEVEVPDTLKANLSLAVTDAQVSTVGSDDIVSRLLLTSDLRGYIHNPGYYFSSASDSVKEHRDLLLLTHGWRRYNWEALAAGVLPKVRFPRDNYLAIRGNIYGIMPGQIRPEEQINVIIEARDTSRQFLAVPVKRDGSFSQGGLIFYDTVKLYHQLNSLNRINRKATVEFARQAFPASIHLGIDTTALLQAHVAPASLRAQYFAQKREEVLPELNKQIRVLENVTVRARTQSREQELDKRYASGMFQSGNARSFNLIDDPAANSYMDVLQYLQGKVAGLQISRYGGSYSLSRRGSVPSLFVNEMQADADLLTSIPVSDIAYIKVFDPPFMGAVGGGPGGAIAIYTRKGGEGTRSTSPGLAKGTLAGYSVLKEFYSPDYATSSPLHEVEDVRSTLYWEPFLLTDKTSKKVRIEFYNNDVSTSLRVVLEGMNEEGRLTRVEQVIR
jgi:hypothetical protein